MGEETEAKVPPALVEPSTDDDENKEAQGSVAKQYGEEPAQDFILKVGNFCHQKAD